MAKAVLTIQNLQKKFGQQQVLTDINGTVHEGEVICIIGPSGSGKSTLLRCLNQLTKPSAGSVHFEKSDLTEASPQELAKLGSKIGMVFQAFHLFANRTVMQNLTLAPERVKGLSADQAQELGQHYLNQVGLAEKAGAYPRNLSGGQQQRVAIARALAMQPELLLFDEPTSALDPENVGEVLKVIKALAAENKTMVIVTHEMGFARQVADQIWLMADGVIQEKGAPEQFFTQPKQAITKQFLSDVLAQ
ncbi:amino acid ABC transporter ATP-binding protein [Leuconostocaceae bacterium ESL0958]|nr:amino acid ABC transporter ATP-binding protein [Leuconostocaceae bacterium ESL0958]